MSSGIRLAALAAFCLAVSACGGSSSSQYYLLGDGGPADSSLPGDSGVPDATACTTGRISCGGACIDPLSNQSHCSRCNNPCSEQSCVNGVCTLACPAGERACGTQCINPLTSNEHCGATVGCGTLGGSAGAQCDVDGGKGCTNGACLLACGPGLIDCGGTCIDPLSTNAYCGATLGCGVAGGSAGTACPGGYVCQAGTCQVSCPAGLVACAGRCVDPMTNPSYCGATAACATPGRVCAAGGYCSNGICSPTACPFGQVLCSGACMDPQSSTQYCGATPGCGVGGLGVSGARCASGGACTAGVCTCPMVGQLTCNGTCIDPLTSTQYCGATQGCGVGGSGSAGQVCASGGTCRAGTCTCPMTGQITCGGTCIDPLTSSQYCGATAGCGVAGGSVGKVCTGGTSCVQGTCACAVSGTIACGGSCINPLTSSTYCGATQGCGTTGGSAGQVCTTITGRTCQLGSCVCPASQFICGTACIDPQTNSTYCGATQGCGVTGGSAGQVCTTITGRTCQAGTCSCLSGQLVCGTACINPLTSSAYCGATQGCGVSGGSAGETCTGGETCRTGICACATSGYVSCGGSCINPLTSAAYCGATDGCGVTGGSVGETCAGGETCQTGACACPVGQIMCDPTCINPQSSTAHCGATLGCGITGGSAGQVCGLGETCNSGVCGVAVCSAASLTTTYSAGNSYNGNMFDVTVYRDIIVHTFDVNLAASTATPVAIYYRAGSYVGYTMTQTGWNLLATVTVNGAGQGIPVPLNAGLNLSLTPGTYAFYITTTDGTTMYYTNGSAVGTTYTSNPDLGILNGAGGSLFDVSNSPRVWNGTIYYDSCP